MLLICGFSILLTAVNSKLIFTTGSYFPQYEKYKFDSPNIILNADIDIFNITDDWGIGGNTMCKFSGSKKQFISMQTYDLYAHKFWNMFTPNSYFLHGFFGGIKNTNLYYRHHSTNQRSKLKMIRPLVGYRFSSEIWGFTVGWTQSEQKKSVWEYELKYREKSGGIMQIGGSLKGPIDNMKSGVYITFGYEFYL